MRGQMWERGSHRHPLNITMCQASCKLLYKSFPITTWYDKETNTQITDLSKIMRFIESECLVFNCMFLEPTLLRCLPDAVLRPPLASRFPLPSVHWNTLYVPDAFACRTERSAYMTVIAVLGSLLHNQVRIPRLKREGYAVPPVSSRLQM